MSGTIVANLIISMEEEFAEKKERVLVETKRGDAKREQEVKDEEVEEKVNLENRHSENNRNEEDLDVEDDFDPYRRQFTVGDLDGIVHTLGPSRTSSASFAAPRKNFYYNYGKEPARLRRGDVGEDSNRGEGDVKRGSEIGQTPFSRLKQPVSELGAQQCWAGLTSSPVQSGRPHLTPLSLPTRIHKPHTKAKSKKLKAKKDRKKEKRSTAKV